MPTPSLISLSLLAACGDKDDADDSGNTDTNVRIDADADGYYEDEDCDDNNGDVFPGAPELCNEVDDDCDDVVDEDATDPSTFFVDGDDDGFGTGAKTVDACTAPAGYVDNADDCDDVVAEVNPDADEICNEIDDNCDKVVDLDASDAGTYYADLDGDKFGDSTTSVVACEVSKDFVSDDTDCNDDNEDVYPGAKEVCGDDVVNDCDATPAEASAVCPPPWPSDLTTADATITGSSSEGVGAAVSLTGDVDGDGLADVLVGAPNRYEEGAYGGRAYLHLGGATSGSVGSDAGEATLSDNTQFAGFGSSVAIARDQNADGFDEILVGAPTHNEEVGQAHLFLGPVSGALASTASDATITGLSGGTFGRSVADAGDVDGDGVSDLLFGAPYYSNEGVQGMAFLFLGPVSGEVSVSSATGRLGDGITNNRVGQSVASAGDVDGDGLQDLLVGAPDTTVDETSFAGAAYLVLGSKGIGDVDLDTESQAQFYGNDSYGRVAQNVAGVGDVNGDGLDDVVIGAPYTNVSENEGAGVSYLFFGGVSGAQNVTSADAQIGGPNEHQFLGTANSAAGDVNADGFDDILVGAPYDSENTGSGAAYLALGPISGAVLATDVGSEALGPVSEQSGYAVSGGADTNGDGVPDAVIGSPAGNGSAYLILNSKGY